MKTNHHHIFVGPTAFKSGIDFEAFENITLHPPIKRRGIENLMKDYEPSTAVIVDGNFHSCASVGHYELRKALKNGWNIIGLASMGAIRAAEMQHLGMKGYGKLFRYFSLYPEFRDDEVTLMHGIDAPYFPISEPMIHLRYYLKHLKETQKISAENHRQIIHTLENLYFGERTIDRCNELLEKLQPNCLTTTQVNFDTFRIKNEDFKSFMHQLMQIQLKK